MAGCCKAESLAHTLALTIRQLQMQALNVTPDRRILGTRDDDLLLKRYNLS